jgi:hypothetical protein
MRNKSLIQQKVEKVESLLKLIGYSIRRAEYDNAYSNVEVTIEKLEEIRTLLNTEVQD